VQSHAALIRAVGRATQRFALPALLALHVALVQAAPFAYIPSTLASDVRVIDTASNGVVATVTVGMAPFGVAVAPDGAFVYVANLRSNTVSVIDAASNTVAATVPVGGAPRGVAVAPNGAFVVVATVLLAVAITDTLLLLWLAT
jgi:YVTN family beta-propeller protein